MLHRRRFPPVGFVGGHHIWPHRNLAYCAPSACWAQMGPGSTKKQAISTGAINTEILGGGQQQVFSTALRTELGLNFGSF